MAQFFWPSLPDLSDWFTVEEVSRKRGEIAELIRITAQDQAREAGAVQEPVFPKIKFTAEKKMPRKRRKKYEEEEDSDEEQAVK